MNVDNQYLKDYWKNDNEDLIWEHESKYQCSQSNLKKDIEEEKKLQLSDESSSELASNNSDIHGEGDGSNLDVGSEQYLNGIQEVRDVSILYEKKQGAWLNPFYEVNLSEVEVTKKLKNYQKLLYIGF